MTTPLNTFDVDIFFVGLFALVLDDAGNDPKIALVVPQSDERQVKHQTTAQDGKPLYRHRWFVEFDPAQLTDPPTVLPESTLAHWQISEPGGFRRLTFDTKGASGLKLGTALCSVLDFAKVAPDYADLPSQHLGWPDSSLGPPTVAGQIMFDKGQLVEPSTVTQWIFPGTLTDDGPHDQSAYYAIHLELTKISEFIICSRSAKGGPEQALKLHGTPNLPVKISICNLCDINPLRWKAEQDPRVDDDYRWYYQLIEDPEELRNTLNGLDLPVPHPSGKSAGQGQNCLGTQFKPQIFTMD